jgi:hypothetical protein
MGCYKQCSACLLIGITLSIIFGVIVGILFFFGYVPLIETAVWIAFGIAAFALAILLISAIFSNREKVYKCLRANAGALLTGIIGTLITAIAALSIILTPGSVLIAILIGLGAIFLGVTLTALVCLILCLLDLGW